MDMFYFIIIIIDVVVATAHKIPYRVCQDGHNNLRKYLNNKMVWQEDLQKFVDILETCSEMIRSLTWNNNTIRIATLEKEPYLSLNKDSDRLEGYLGDIWSIMLEIFDFKYVLIPTSYMGGLQLTESGKVDMYFGPVVATEHNYNAAFSQPYINNWYYLYIRLPDLSINSSFYLKICSARFWLVTTFSFLILTAAIWTTGKILKKIDPSEPNVSIFTCFLASISGLINQGYDLKFRSASARAMILFSMSLGTILYTAMCAMLYSKMTVHDFRLPINNMEEIPEKGYHLCMRNDTFVYDTFLNTNKEVVPKWKNTINSDRCLDITIEHNIQKIICKETVVVLENSFVISAKLTPRYNNLKCKIIHLRQKYFKRGNVYYIAKHMKYFRTIQRAFIKMKTSGVLQYLEMKYRKKQADEDFETRWYTVTLDHVQGVLIWYAGMIFLSLIVLGIEILCEKLTYYKTYPWNE